MNIILSSKLKSKLTFAIVRLFIVKNLRATDSCISPGLIDKVHSIYISFPWFRFTHVDLALTERVLFRRWIPINIRPDATDLFYRN